MKGPLDRTKVVLRHLPPTITQAQLLEQIDGAFAGRYNWVSFRPGKNSPKHQIYSRAYIDFKGPDDVIEFAEFFDGHVFVNEKGSQYKALVEYAPSQRVPKQWFKKDGREGTIAKDSEYMEFLELIGKPVENLPSAEIQLERREADRAGAANVSPIITPLMDFVRLKRAAKSGTRRSLPNGKLSRGVGRSIGGSSSPASSKRGSEKKRVSTTMHYVSRDGAKSTNGKDKSSGTLVSKQDDQDYSEKPVTSTATSGTETLEGDSGVSITTDSGKKKILLLKGKGKEISHPVGGLSQQHSVVPPVKNLAGAPRQNQRHEVSGRIVRSILINKDLRSSQPSVVQSEQQAHSLNSEDRRPPRSSHLQFISKDKNMAPENKLVGKEMHGYFGERNEKHTRNRDRSDRGVRAFRHSDGSHASDESMSSSASQPTHLSESWEGNYGDMKHDMPNARIGEARNIRSGRSAHSYLDNGSHKHAGRRGPAHGSKDTDGSSVISDMKSKRGGAPVHASHDKQVWVQKSSSGP